MIHYNIGGVVIRDIEMKDIEILTEGEKAQGWHWASTEKTASRLPDRDAGKCVVLVAEYNGEPAGYVSLYWNAESGAYKDLQIPEIVDFNVLVKFRRKGIGSKLMDVCEQLAGTRCDRVCLGVGLYRDYGTAQRIYVKRGYIPDGTGAWYGADNCVPGKNYCLDDDLILFLSKELKK